MAYRDTNSGCWEKFAVADFLLRMIRPIPCNCPSVASPWFDCPDASHTSPMSTDFTVIVFLPFTVSVCDSLMA